MIAYHTQLTSQQGHNLAKSRSRENELLQLLLQVLTHWQGICSESSTCP